MENNENCAQFSSPLSQSQSQSPSSSSPPRFPSPTSQSPPPPASPTPPPTELPESQRADAVSSMVYEANARIRDPVYGCAGAICQLQKQVSELQAQLAKAQAEIVTMQCQQANLVAIILEMTQAKEPNNINSQQIDTTCFLDDNNLASAWEPLWT
ncbi:hypothetical protein V6N12_032307 [Hibiscus sabdariffa]|uniref:LOB domain-containing protein n=1 Tax=Hibiscus sabdariffa TaxID=183260 RepID=A0ABR2CC85_9ROSI